MSQSISLWGASYTDVPGVLLPKTGGGTALFSDATPTTALAADVTSGKYFLAADGTLTQGTASGGGGTTWTTLYNASTYIYYGTPPYLIFNPYEEAFGADETYRVTWAGTSYTCQTRVDTSGTSYDGYYIGNEYLVGGTTDTGEPFLIYRDQASRALAVTNMTSGQNIIVKIEKQVSGGANLQAKTNINPTTSSQTITADTGYDGLSSVQINAMPTMTLPTAASASSSGTAKATITPGSSAQYINIPTGYNGAAAYYTISAAGGGSGLTLLKTTSLGAMSSTASTGTDTGKTLTLTGFENYDVLIVDISVDTAVNGRHTSTVSMIYVTGTSNVNTKNTYAVGGNKWNSKLSSSGTGSTRSATTGYGIYVNAATVSNNTMTMTLYYRYSSTNTTTIDGTYTARVYGLHLYTLIGG